jgi:hypothetical protein
LLNSGGASQRYRTVAVAAPAVSVSAGKAFAHDPRSDNGGQQKRSADCFGGNAPRVTRSIPERSSSQV